MNATDYNALAVRYEGLAVQFGAQRAYESVKFYREVAQRCRDYAGYARGAA